MRSCLAGLFFQSVVFDFWAQTEGKNFSSLRIFIRDVSFVVVPNPPRRILNDYADLRSSEFHDGV